MNKIDKFLLKNRNTLKGVLAVGVLGYIISKLLDWTFKNSGGFIRALNTKVHVPIFAIIISLLIVLIISKIRISISYSRRHLIITSARYGANNSFVDITDEMNSKVEDDRIKIVIDNSIAGDPVPGLRKKALVSYEYDGKKNTTEVAESEVLELP